MKVGDVIVEVAGKAIGNSRDLVRTVQQAPERTFAVKVVRDRKELTLDVTTEMRTPERQQVRGVY